MKTIAANSLLFASCMADTLRWRLATRHVAETQAQILLKIVRANTATAFGQDHDFAGIRTAADYQERVPVRDYSEIEPYINRCAAGETSVLTREPVMSFALSSGSTSASKLIPYTPTLMRDFRRSISPWLVGMYMECPALLGGRSYWQISPAGTPSTLSFGGIPIGFGKDTEYFGRRTAALVRATLAVDEAVAANAQMDEFRFETLRQLLACRDLRFISIWNPSFLTLLLWDLMQLVGPLVERVRKDGHESRAHELAEVFALRKGMNLSDIDGAGRTLPEAIWPELRLISCWADAAAHDAADRLRALFPHTPIQAKGLIATEGLMSFPWGATGSVLAVTSHFFEFVDSDSEGTGRAPRLAHQLEMGRRYSILLTTSGGLYRYLIGDVIEVTDHFGQCPVLRFLGKEDGVVDLVGEKLNSVHVARVAEEVFTRYAFRPRFWMLAPERSGQTTPCYNLYMQSNCATPDGVLSALEAGLEQNFHYAYARRLGQLAPLQLFLIDPESDPESEYLAFCAAHGQRLGNIKRPYLDRNDVWSGIFRHLGEWF